MHCHLYLRKGRVFIPTSGLVPGGPYRDIEPVAVVEVSDADGLRQAFRETIARGNPPPPPYPRPYPPPVVVKYAGVKSWAAFARGALPWSIEEENGTFSNYRPPKNSRWLGGRPRSNNYFLAGHHARSGNRPHDCDLAGDSAEMIRHLLRLVAGRFLFGWNALRYHLYLEGQGIRPHPWPRPRGPYRDIEPVAAVEASDAEALSATRWRRKIR